MEEQARQSVSSRVRDELGLTSLSNASRDVYLLLFTRFIRMFAYGSSAVVLALYLANLGYSDTMIGLFMTLTLVGDVVISLILTVMADQLGRRRILVFGGLLMTLSGVIFALVSNYWILLLAAVVGVISASGNEIGPFRAVEESILAHLADVKTRADIFAFYVVVGTLGGAGGSLACGWITQALQNAGWEESTAFRFVFWIYAGIGIVKALTTMTMSQKCELDQPDRTFRGQDNGERRQLLSPETTDPIASVKSPPQVNTFSRLSQHTISLVTRFCALSFFDSLGSGMVPNTLIAYFIWIKFAVPEGQLGSIIAAALLTSSIGNIFASSIAKRIGMVKTMVFTHLPSAIFLSLIPVPTSIALTIFFIVARSCLSAMDQAPRSAFLSAVVLPEERTAVMGIVNTVKTMSQSAGPVITGALAGGDRFWVAFIVAGSMKIAYDIGLLVMFVQHDPQANNDRHDTESPQTEAIVEDEDGR